MVTGTDSCLSCYQKVKTEPPSLPCHIWEGNELEDYLGEASEILTSHIESNGFTRAWGRGERSGVSVDTMLLRHPGPEDLGKQMRQALREGMMYSTGGGDK